MALLSALDDFLNRTLGAIPGMLARLDYLSSLKNETGYNHWGMIKVHGEQPAQRALADAHRMLLSEILQTPLQSLMDDSEAACAADGRKTPDYVEELRVRHFALLPEPTSAVATSRHFNSVLYALSALTRAQRRAIHPTS